MELFRTLWVTRHGKAEKDAATGQDADRALKPRGIRQAQYLGEHLVDLPSAQRPRLILASPIIRAADTARIIAQASGIPLHLRGELSTEAGIREVLSMLEEYTEHPHLMTVGHNPTCDELVYALCGRPNGSLQTAGAPLAHRYDGMRTGMSAVIGFADQRAIARGHGVLLAVHREDWGEE